MTNRTAVPAEFQEQAKQSRRSTSPGASTAQMDYLLSLLDERDVPADARELMSQRARNQLKANQDQGDRARIEDGISLPRASEFIARLKERPRKTSQTPATAGREQGLPDVPAGRYALREADGVTRFYRVDRPEEGRWAGWTFLKIQASDDLHPIKDRVRKGEVLRAIAADPAAASKLYGQELGHCGVCGRTLTDETSREYGIGPVCRNATGW